MTPDSTAEHRPSRLPASRGWIALAMALMLLSGMPACSQDSGVNGQVAQQAATATSAQADQGSTPTTAVPDVIPGDFDYWLIALSWSPTYCEFNPGNREQCGNKGFGFVLHGLWPQYERGSGPQDCRSRQRVSERTIDRSMAFMPSRGLIIHEWRSHGSCTTLEPDDYFELADRAYASVQIPEPLRTPRNSPRLTARDITAAFVQANPGLSSDAIRVMCTGERLSEVRVCANADLSSRRCGKLSRSRCPGGPLRIPVVR